MNRSPIKLSRRGMFFAGAAAAGSLAVGLPRRAAAGSSVRSDKGRNVDEFAHAHISIYLMAL